MCDPDLETTQVAQRPFSALVSVPPLQEGHAELNLDAALELWWVNGGALAALALNAAEQLSEHLIPLSLTMDFLRPAKAGAAEISARALAEHRASTLAEVIISQEGKARAQARVWAVSAADGPDHRIATMPACPDPEEVLPLEAVFAQMTPRPNPPPGFWKLLEQRPINRLRLGGRRAPQRQYLRWYRYRDDLAPVSRFASMARTLPLIDALGYASAEQFHGGPFLPSLAPTATLTVHFRDTRYRGPWLLVDALCEYADEGFLSSEVKVWGTDGDLLAQGVSQMVFRPGSGAGVTEPGAPSA